METALTRSGIGLFEVGSILAIVSVDQLESWMGGQVENYELRNNHFFLTMKIVLACKQDQPARQQDNVLHGR